MYFTRNYSRKGPWTNPSSKDIYFVAYPLVIRFLGSLGAAVILSTILSVSFNCISSYVLYYSNIWT